MTETEKAIAFFQHKAAMKHAAGYAEAEYYETALSALREAKERENTRPLPLERFEQICKAVHNGWWEEKKRQGVTDHPDMVPYCELPEAIKEYDRVTVRRVLDALGIAYKEAQG